MTCQAGGHFLSYEGGKEVPFFRQDGVAFHGGNTHSRLVGNRRAVMRETLGS